jgi:hypothetical protein
MGLMSMSAVASAATVAFSSPSDFTNNFRTTLAVTNGGTIGQNSAAGPDGSAGILRDTASGSGSASYIALYDTTPADNTTQNTFVNEQVQADFRMSAATSSFGLFSRVNGAETAGYLGLINIDASGTNDQIRIFDSTAPNSTAVGTTLANTTTTSSALSLNTWYTMLFSSANDGSNVDLSLKIFNYGDDPAVATPLLTASATDTTTPLTSAGEVGLRFNAVLGAGNTVDADNFTVPSTVPEPSCLGLLVLGSAVLLKRRRA